MEKPESEKCQGDLVIVEPPLYCEMYFQELKQIPIVSNREESPPSLAFRGGKESF